ncbi:MAG: transporter substrate-binding domain-containing protein [Pseudomonadales bacterium]|nr:transporter substrate-binding domain-containing protein [Pseudomonadales bacterium]MBH2078155.1 transporter substrate-binding domain-containing protein [Pseudomonadales bacterium]
MKMICRVLLSILIVLAPPVCAEPLSLLSRAANSNVTVSLNTVQRQWLARKATFRVGVYLPDRPPLDISAGQRDYEGLSADYLDVVARGLGVRVQINRYDSQQQALAALQQDEVDLVPRINHLEPTYADLLLTAPYAYDQAVLISRFGTHWINDQPPPGTTVLFDPDWTQQERVAALFPTLPLESVRSTEQGLGLVAYSEYTVLLTDAISAQYLLEQSYQQSLKQTTQRDSEGLGFSFAVQRQDNQLRTLLNNALSNISPQERAVIAQRWGVGANPSLGFKRLQLTATEQQWIKDNPQIDVLATDLYSPFSFFNADDQLRGMAVDLLELINDRTGLSFRPVKITSVDALTSRVQREPVSLIAALTSSAEREQQLAFSRPYLTNPFALVTRTQTEHSGLTGLKDARVAIVKGSAAANWLKREWPDIKRVEVDAPIETYELLAEGQVEGVIQPQLGAAYLIDRFFRGRLQIDSVIGSQPARIGFATGHQNPELIAILNKALLDIPPEKFNDLANLWQNPQESQGGWNRYKSWFYKALTGALIVLLGILAWNLGLRRQIVERQKAQKALNDQLVFMKVLVDGTPHPIYVRNRQGLLLTCNRAYLQVMQIELDQVLGKGLIEADILTPEDAWSYKRIHQATLHSGEPSFDNFAMTVKGNTYHIYHWALPYRDSDGNMTGVIGGWIDLTEQTHLQHALHQAKDLAEAANRGKSHFLAVMSHEIRTPMSALIGVLELMRDKRPDAELVNIAQKSASGMMELIGEILDLSKIESGKFELRVGTCHPQHLVNSVIQGFASLAQQKSVELEFEPQGADIPVVMDSLRLRQIVSNLISNAIKFTPQGMVIIQLGLQTEGDLVHLCLRVQDTGVGITEAQRQRLFQPYTQFASSDSELQMGSGLGLAICQQLTELMGGRLTCTSEPGSGSCFTLELNAAVATDDQTVPALDIETSVPLPARNILIVEDHEFNRVVLQRQLESLGMRVVCAHNGTEGLRYWAQEDFDYVITDCNMPRMSGEQMTRQLRAREAQENLTPTHVVGLTANAQPEEIQRCVEAGMNDCLFKPLDRTTLERYLRQAEQTRQVTAPCFDISSVSDITAGDPVMTRQLLATVLRTNQEDFDVMQAMYAAGDFNEMSRCCHKVLGSARIIHAAALINACEKLEQGCKASVPVTELSGLYQVFVEQMQRLTHSIQSQMNH